MCSHVLYCVQFSYSLYYQLTNKKLFNAATNVCYQGGYTSYDRTTFLRRKSLWLPNIFKCVHSNSMVTSTIKPTKWHTMGNAESTSENIHNFECSTLAHEVSTDDNVSLLVSFKIYSIRYFSNSLARKRFSDGKHKTFHCQNKEYRLKRKR